MPLNDLQQLLRPRRLKPAQRQCQADVKILLCSKCCCNYPAATAIYSITGAVSTFHYSCPTLMLHTHAT
jgi:hypothetical protein